MWSSVFSAPPIVLWMVAICAGIGALILTAHTRVGGTVGLLINFTALFAGGYLMNILVSEIEVPLENSVEKAVFATLIGMTIASFVTLVFLARDRTE